MDITDWSWREILGIYVTSATVEGLLALVGMPWWIFVPMCLVTFTLFWNWCEWDHDAQHAASVAQWERDHPGGHA